MLFPHVYLAIKFFLQHWCFWIVFGNAIDCINLKRGYFADIASGSPNDRGNDVNMDSVFVNDNSTNTINNQTNQSLTCQRSVENFGQSKTTLLTTNENAMPSACLVGARKKTNSGMTAYADCAKRLAIVTNQSAVSVDCNTKNC